MLKIIVNKSYYYTAQHLLNPNPLWISQTQTQQILLYSIQSPYSGAIPGHIAAQGFNYPIFEVQIMITCFKHVLKLFTFEANVRAIRVAKKRANLRFILKKIFFPHYDFDLKILRLMSYH